MSGYRSRRSVLVLLAAIVVSPQLCGKDEPAQRTYRHRLTLIEKPQLILADYPKIVAPIKEEAHFEAAPLIQDEQASLSVRSWRFSYNARGIIEIPNLLQGRDTALIVVHPWGIDDGQGWKTPEPAGAAFFCTPQKNHLARRHVAKVINPFLAEMRNKVGLIAYSLPGKEDPIRKNLYRSVRGRPTKQSRVVALKELNAKLGSFRYRGRPLPAEMKLSKDTPVADYFRQAPSLDAGPRYNNQGFWDLPIPVMKEIDVHADDAVIYDADGYEALKAFLKEQGIRHVLLAGFATDACVCRTTAGYENLRHDFNVFLVGDATIATFAANTGPASATNAAISLASLKVLITQISWIAPLTK